MDVTDVRIPSLLKAPLKSEKKLVNLCSVLSLASV